jgi:molybdenum cofactor synthesis domain-containing protein
LYFIKAECEAESVYILIFSDFYPLHCEQVKLKFASRFRPCVSATSPKGNTMFDKSFDNLNAEVIAIGTELLLGALTDTNSVYMAQQLRDLGVNLYFMTSVGDNVGRIAQAIDIALQRADIVITCGGLGPTVDDMTRAGIGQALGRELIYHESLFEAIAERFASYRANIT